MLKALTVALFTNAISGINLDKKIGIQLEETCAANLKRLEEAKPVTGEDTTFPASKYSLFWEEHNKSDAMK